MKKKRKRAVITPMRGPDKSNLAFIEPIDPKRITEIRGMQIVLPVRVARRPRDERGYPILYTTFIRPDKTPDFTSNDPWRANECFEKWLCGICGEKIEHDGPEGHDCYPFYFVGGPTSIERTRVFNDPAMHRECVEFARTVCPWMVAARYFRAKEGENFVAAEDGGLHVMERPPYLGLVRATTYVVDPGGQLAKASPFYEVVAKWNPRAGEPLPTEEEMERYRTDAFAALFIKTYEMTVAQQAARLAAKRNFLALSHIQGQVERGEISDKEGTQLKRFITEGRTNE